MPARMVTTSPNAATPSASHCAPPVLTFSEASSSGSANIACAIMVPTMPPAICTTTQRIARRQLALEREYQSNRWIEMRPRYGAENGDQNHQDRTGGKRVAEQRQ